MPKYFVEMNYVVARSVRFLVDARDDETVSDVLGSMDSDFLEENLPWGVSDYAEPIIEQIRLAKSTDSNVPVVSEKFYKEFNKIEKEVYLD